MSIIFPYISSLSSIPLLLSRRSLHPSKSFTSSFSTTTLSLENFTSTHQRPASRKSWTCYLTPAGADQDPTVSQPRRALRDHHIYLHRIPKKLTHDGLHRILSCYGRVKEILITNSSIHPEFNRATVFFHDQETAMAAHNELLKKPIILNKTQVVVTDGYRKMRPKGLLFGLPPRFTTSEFEDFVKPWEKFGVEAARIFPIDPEELGLHGWDRIREWKDWAGLIFKDYQSLENFQKNFSKMKLSFKESTLFRFEESLSYQDKSRRFVVIGDFPPESTIQDLYTFLNDCFPSKKFTHASFSTRKVDKSFRSNQAGAQLALVEFENDEDMVKTVHKYGDKLAGSQDLVWNGLTMDVRYSRETIQQDMPRRQTESNIGDEQF